MPIEAKPTKQLKLLYQSKKKLAIWKKILIIFSALILVLVSLAIFAYSRYLHPTGEIMPGLYAVRNDRNGMPIVNFFIMQAGEKYIAFDAGSDSEQTQNTLQHLGISPSDVIAVFITHSDCDHVGALHLFYNSSVFSYDTEFRYANTTAFATSVFERPNFPHYTLADGETIEIYDRSILAIHTPGHTSDSVSFLVDGRYLFVGDLLVNPRLARYDEELQIFHIQNTLQMEGIECVFTGHFGLFRSVRLIRWWFS